MYIMTLSGLFAVLIVGMFSILIFSLTINESYGQTGGNIDIYAKNLQTAPPVPPHEPYPYPPYEFPIIPFQTYPFPDPDPPLPPAASVKKGGQDPIVFGNDWWYHENDNATCDSPFNDGFDFDNDRNLNNFCYEIIGTIFVIDFGYGINSGVNMLNFENTILEGTTPYEFMKIFPNACTAWDCYQWTDSNGNWEVDDGELAAYNLVIKSYVDYPYDPSVECTYHDNGRCIYGYGMTSDGEDFYALMPTYIGNN